MITTTKRNNNRFNNNRRNNRKINRFAVKMYKTISLIDRPVFRDIITNAIIHANFHSVSNSRNYSFVATPSVNPTYIANTFQDLILDSEYIKMRADYGYMRVSGLHIRITPIAMNVADLADLPNVYILPSLRGNVSALTPADIAKSDNAIPIKFSNFSAESYLTKVVLPSVMQGNNGLNFGTSLWFDSASTTISNVFFQLFMGQILEPGFIPSTPATNVSRRVATIEVIYTLQFGGPSQ
jgi:hypothetical protein